MVIMNFGGPRRVTATGAAPFDDILDVGVYYGSMTLLLTLIGVEGATGTPSLEITLETAMEPKGGVWIALGSFTPLSVANTADKKTFTGLLRFIRWNVTTLNNVAAATFSLTGIARNP